MPIHWDEDTRQFHLRNEHLSYVMAVLEDGTLGQLHLGAPLAADRSYRHLTPGAFHGFQNRVGEPVRLECPTAGSGDFRVPAVAVEHPDGSTVLRLAYRAHTITRGKPDLPGLPSTYTEDDAEADTLEITLADDPSGLEVHLTYTLFRDRPAIARSARFRNGGAAALRLGTAMSASLDLIDDGWDLLHLSGHWARERQVVVRPLVHGRQSIASLRGASSHQHNPFLVLKRPATTEETGEAIGFSLIYSGNFLAEVEVDQWATARVRIGIEPETFEWALEPGAEFQAPEAVIVWSDHGLGGVSDAFHRLFRERLARGPWRDRERPVLLNNWEGTYFDFDEDRLVAIARSAAELGVELFVLDDGWFGARDDDTTSLGDWFVDRRKLPNGVDGVARRVEELGIKFGLWIEPEMVSRRSRLFEEHPDWAIGVPGRPRTESRQQLVLDYARPEVVDHVFSMIAGVLESAPISYVKWDMNRNITEPWSAALPADRQGEFFHRYILGVYELWRRLTERFTDLLFESCAGGGGRFDPGILAYAPQGWTSDQTDAVERLAIQWGTSMAYPQSSMGAHVSAVPNHQVGRITSLSMRAGVAFFGAFGYELDPLAMTDDERREIAAQVAFYKPWRRLFQFGRFVRLRSPFEGDGNETAWMVVSDDRRQAIVGHFRVLNRPVPGPMRLRLRGLDGDATYRVSTWPSGTAAGERLDRGTAQRFSTGAGDEPFDRGGSELMAAGLVLDMTRDDAAQAGDFRARLFILEAE